MAISYNQGSPDYGEPHITVTDDLILEKDELLTRIADRRWRTRLKDTRPAVTKTLEELLMPHYNQLIKEKFLNSNLIRRLNQNADRLWKKYPEEEDTNYIEDYQGTAFPWEHSNAGGAGDPYRETLKRQMQKHLETTLATLPDREQMIFTLFWYEDCPFAEIAEILRLSGIPNGNITPQRVGQIYRSVSEKLRESLKPYKT